MELFVVFSLYFIVSFCKTQFFFFFLGQYGPSKESVQESKEDPGKPSGVLRKIPGEGRLAPSPSGLTESREQRVRAFVAVWIES